MGIFMIIGAIIGGTVAFVFNVSIVLSLIIGAIAGLIIGYLFEMRAASVKETISPPEQEPEQVQTMQLREEQLDINKVRVQTGEVKVYKEVVEENKTFTVPIKRQELVVESGDEEVYRIPLKEEEVDISKHPVKVNEVWITKQQIEEMEQVKEMIKKEQARVEIHGEADVHEEK
ncbi:YsnF/AvaK domain-containing protein [Halalkalibacter akibai]|uniref:DUF2382 domain-containing protein n=1 Tax=Halalkalibacter akibai (strain ATCC 43226 / DSM 21942 / CIP 109018 / JCM 9157 / 1139) TaxID=1236973 RepID=W4QMV4_HALA3|nr:YsnF/AvaK domain-containing protein [Halalkalibacter akibai]GAE33252.1 hypothetical protein JCM9157_246 [Halalkalibacter akibai JCM 9157]